MSLINCKECANVVSSEAETCPKCGVKIAAESMGCGTKIAIFVIGVVFIGAMSRISSNESASIASIPETPEQAAEKKKVDDAVEKAILGAVMLKKSMRDPDSFKLESANVIDGTSAVCYEYRAKNGFGGVNASKAVFSGDGKMFKTSEMEGFSRRWNKECAGKSGSETKAYINWHIL